MQSLEESTLWEDLDDVVTLNQINEMIKSEFLWLESKADWIKFQILYMS
jgi:hypothetical protein